MTSDTGVDTLLVGVDAACPGVLERVSAAGVIPNLSSFLESGSSAPLRSQIPPWTPSAWPSLYTGVNPGKHGVFGFLRFDDYDWDVVDFADVREHALWEVLGDQGISSVVVNVPVTHPPNAFPGALVPGYVAPDDPTCHPPDLLAELREVVPEYSVYPPESSNRDRQIEHYCETARSRGDAFEYLVDREDPGFGFVQFQVSDTVFHQYPGDWDAVESVYAAIDEAFGQLHDAVAPDTTIVASDHGIGEYTGSEFRVNEFLAEAGYLQTTTEGSGMPSWSSIADARLKSTDSGYHSRRATAVATRAAELAARSGLTADRVYRLLARFGMGEAAADRLPASVVRSGTRRVDFEASTAFMRDRIELGVRLNLEGRESAGVVSPADYSAVRAELIQALEAVRTPDDDAVFEAVVPRELVYHGPYVEEAPDIIAVPAGFDNFLSASLRGEQFGPPSESWNHKYTGIVAIDADLSDSRGVLGDAGGSSLRQNPSILDVAPTVCAALGIRPPKQMEGEPLETDADFDLPSSSEMEASSSPTPPGVRDGGRPANEDTQQTDGSRTTPDADYVEDLQ